MTVRTLLLLCAAGITLAEDVLTGFRLSGLRYQGPGEWRHSAEAIWAYDYHKLRIEYRASGFPQSDSPVLTLRPGSVGPVTPGATNRENPFAMGMPVVVLRAKELLSDGASHRAEIDIRSRLKTAQVDQLLFTLPAGANLTVDEIEFRGDPEILPCDSGPPLPDGTEPLPVQGPHTCRGAAATSLRGRESIRIEGQGKQGRAIYFSLLPHFAGLSNLFPGKPADFFRVKESRETAHVLAQVKYATGPEEEQFPLLVSERRHALLNRTPAVYSLALDAGRPLVEVELLDRSPHAQLVLFGAGLSPSAPPEPLDEPPPPKPSGKPIAEADLEQSKWFRIEAVKGKVLAENALRPDIRVVREKGSRSLTFTLTNTSDTEVEFTLAFPSVTVRPAADPDDVYYLYPRPGAVISRREQTLENIYGSRFPLQFVDVFAPAANRGACVIVRDTSGEFKTFRLRKSGAVVEVEAEYVVRLKPGETYRPPEASVVPHGGDWREGFNAYRKWLNTWYKPAGPRPVWLRTAFWCRRDYPVGGSGQLFDVRANRYTFEQLIRDGERFGGIDFIDISGWGLSDTVGRVGDYPIELGGAGNLRDNIARAKRAGIETGLYFEGYLVDKNSGIGKRSGAQWQVIDANGKPAWWPGGSPELFVCPHIPAWHEYLAGRMAAVAAEVGAGAVYIDEHGFGVRRCYSTDHGHPPGVGPVPGEIAMAVETRRALNAAGMNQTMIYLEEAPVDAAAPYYDAAFCYALPQANSQFSPAKLNLWRFAFPDVRLWDMLSTGIHPRGLPVEDFRLSLWHGNGVWLKGHSETWYGEDVLAFLQRARQLLKKHEAAFNGAADPLVDSPHPAVLTNRFRGGGKTVYTLFNASYRTVQFAFEGRRRVLAPRDVEVIESAQPE